jgi:hypothetical protein
MDNPREWQDNFGKMVCFHGRYDLPQEGERKFSSPSEFDEWVQEQNGKLVILPIYMLDHSGQTVRTFPFEGIYGYWDSGKIGYIYATYDMIRTNFIRKRVTENLVEKSKELLIAEVAEYDRYIRGEEDEEEEEGEA